MAMMACCCLSVLAAQPAYADWPTFRGDAARSGYTPEALPNRLVQCWTYRAKHAPAPAWPTHTRIEFDQVFQPIIAQQTVIFGSSSDDQVKAIDLFTGQLKWTFFTEGPIRFAPVAWNDRVFVASDDGWLYALSLADGALIWKKRGGSNDERILGNERLISHWPARGGPVVVGNEVYFAAGIWPSDGIFLHALNAETGEAVWSNRDSGRIDMNQPHGGARAASGISAQGYLVATADQLFVPTGRAVPAAFDRMTGTFQYFHLQKNQKRGGTRVMAADQFLCNAGCLFGQESGQLTQKVGLGAMAATPKGLLHAGHRSLTYSTWADIKKNDRKGKPVTVRQLVESKVIPLDYNIEEIIIAGDDAYCGSSGQVTAIDYKAQTNTWWAHKTEGTVRGLVASDGYLVISTDQGILSCFSNPAAKATQPGGPQAEQQAVRSEIDQAVNEILSKTAAQSGYCVDLGAGDCQLALELARRTQLQIYAVVEDTKQASNARAMLEHAGLYGTRVTVHVADPATVSYPKQFANLVVSSRSLDGDLDAALLKQARRIQRPSGGELCLGAVGKMTVEKRPALQGAGSWTHQYSNASNTVNSQDEIVKGPLKMFWYRDVDFDVPNRHGQGPAPLFNKGVMVVGGLHGLCGLDAYNGRTLWVYNLPGNLTEMNGIHHDVSTAEAGSNFCLGGDFVFVRKDDVCYQLQLQTGKLVQKFRTPAPPESRHRDWGYLAYHQGMLFGTVNNNDHYTSPRYKGLKLRNESVLFFAIDLQTGKHRWQYQPEHSLRNNAITLGNGNAYLIDRIIAKADHVENSRRNGRPRPTLKSGEHPGGLMIAFDARTGEKLWESNQDIFGTQLALSEEAKTLLMFYQGVRHTFFQLPSEVGGRLAAFNATTGKPLWKRAAKYQSRPVINGKTIYAQGGAWELKTGEDVEFKFNRSYGCGQISSSRHLMVFRSATLGYFDMTRDKGVENFGGMRLGCYINAIPAGGLVLVPDGSSKCTCSYQMQAWFALQGSD